MIHVLHITSRMAKASSCFVVVILLVALPVVVQSQSCQPDMFIDVDPAVHATEQFEVTGDCSLLIPSPAVCPENFAQVGGTSKYCGKMKWQSVSVCRACSIRRYIVPKEVLTSCEHNHTTWCGFAPNDFDDPETSNDIEGPDINLLLGGLWYLDGNKAEEEAATFHGSTWSEDGLDLKVFKGRNWAMGDTEGANQTSISYLNIGAGVRFKFNMTAAKQANVEIATLGVFTSIPYAQSILSPLYEALRKRHEILDYKIYTTTDPNILLRTTASGELQYTMRRFVSPDGKPVAENFAIWKADVFHEPRPDTGSVREVPYPMLDLWLNEKLEIAQCPKCKATSRCIGTMRARGLCATP